MLSWIVAVVGKINRLAVAVHEPRHVQKAVRQKAAMPKRPLDQESAARHQTSYPLHLLEMWKRHRLIMSITNP
jgi:hypothetical protein